MGLPVIEALRRDGMDVVRFVTTNASKQAAVDALSLAFERGELEIVKDAELVAELQAYEAERLPSGMMRYGAPEGMHDDCVMALMIANQGAGRYGHGYVGPGGGAPSRINEGLM